MQTTLWRFLRRRTIGCATLAVLALAVAPALASASTSYKLKSGTVTITFTQAVYAQMTKSTTGAFGETNSVSPVTPATTPKAARFVFPISGGKLNSKTWAGKVSSSGGLGFTQTSTGTFGGGEQFAFISLALHLGGSQPTITATFAGANTNPGESIATLVTKHIRHSKRGNKVTLSDITLKATSTWVSSVFGSYRTGETLGTVTVSGTT